MANGNAKTAKQATGKVLAIDAANNVAACAPAAVPEGAAAKRQPSPAASSSASAQPTWAAA
jgi:hypothetical protein